MSKSAHINLTDYKVQLIGPTGKVVSEGILTDFERNGNIHIKAQMGNFIVTEKVDYRFKFKDSYIEHTRTEAPLAEEQEPRNKI